MPGNNAASALAKVLSPIPIITSVRRLGIHAQPTRLVLTLNRPLLTGWARNPGNYQLRLLEGPHSSISIKRAVVGATSQTVILHPTRHLNLHQLFRLTVEMPKSVHRTTIIDAKDLVLETKNRANVRAVRSIIARKSGELRRLKFD
jgi:hypothetical protein